MIAQGFPSNNVVEDNIMVPDINYIKNVINGPQNVHSVDYINNISKAIKVKKESKEISISIDFNNYVNPIEIIYTSALLNRLSLRAYDAELLKLNSVGFSYDDWAIPFIKKLRFNIFLKYMSKLEVIAKLTSKKIFYIKVPYFITYNKHHRDIFFDILLYYTNNERVTYFEKENSIGQKLLQNTILANFDIEMENTDKLYNIGYVECSRDGETKSISSPIFNFYFRRIIPREINDNNDAIVDIFIEILKENFIGENSSTEHHYYTGQLYPTRMKTVMYECLKNEAMQKLLKII